MDKWDENENKKIPLEKFMMTKNCFDAILSDCYAYRFMIKQFPQYQKFFEVIREICDTAQKTFHTPENPDDRKQIEDFIKKEFERKFNAKL